VNFRAARFAGGVAWIAVISAVSSVSQAADRVVVDRPSVRYTSPETGGPASPRFLTEREIAFRARLEATYDKSAEPMQDRYVRPAIERHIAEDMLSELLITRGTDPIALPQLAASAKAELCDRTGAHPGDCSVLDQMMKTEGIDETELLEMLRRQVRAEHYVDRVISPILRASEEDLREAFRTSQHAYKGMPFEDAKPMLLRWLVHERIRAAEVEFLQAARSRVRIVILPSTPSGYEHLLAT
jgi:hypothetical protein